MPADILCSNDGIQYASGAIVDVKAAMPVSGTYTAGSIVLELTTSNRISGWKRLTTGSGHVLNTDWAYFNMPASPQSMVRVHTSNGYGSGSTMIRRFTTIVTNQGTDITYADSASLGGTFTINAAGVYAIAYADQANAAADFGLSLNSAQLTTAVASITTATRLIMAATPAANASNAVSWVGALSATDVIRAHTAATAVGTAPDRTTLTITRVA